MVAPAQDQGIEPVLLAEAVGRLGMPAARLHQHDLGVKARLLVHLVDEVIGIGAQEIALAELYDLFRGLFRQETLVALFFQRFKKTVFPYRSPLYRSK